MPVIRSAGAAAQSIAVSALKAESARMRVIAENIANANSTSSTPGGDPYRRQIPVFSPTKVDGGQGVRMVRTQPDATAFKDEYNPGHPSADNRGFVKMPNVDPLVEALDMRTAQRVYEANLNIIETARSMESRTLDLLRK